MTNYLYRQLTYGERTDFTSNWGMQCIGMFRSFQDIQEYVQANNITSYMGLSPDQIRPGMLIYKDVRGTNGVGGPDGIVDQNDDQVHLSNRTNPYGFSLNLSAEWKGISLSTQFQANWGGYSFIDGAALKTGDGLAITNMPTFWNPDDMFVYEDITDGSGNVIMKQNREAHYPNLAYQSVNAATSNFWRVSGTRIKWSRITLAYSLPAKWLRTLGIGIKSVRLNVTGQNLLSLYNPFPEKYIDPMSNYGRYPALRKFTLGVNVSF